MKYVIIGNGIAGTTAAENIRKIDDGQITILSDEEYPFYNRIRLINFLSSSVDEKALIIKDDDWYRDNNIDLILNAAVTDINAKSKELITSQRKCIPYDRLLLAMGGRSFIPPIPGSDKTGVFSLRTLDDAKAINDHVKKGNKRIILIGGGVLGLEAGYNLIKAGCTVAVVEFFPRLLPRQMDPDGAALLQTQMEEIGFQFHLGVSTSEIQGAENARRMTLTDGTSIDGDMVLISAGVRPRIELAQKLNLTIEKGVVVNDRMETNLRDIYAAGDVIEHRGIVYGIWPASEKQGEVAGINMAGGNAAYKGTTIANVLKVAGIDLAAAGNIDADRNYESIVFIERDNFIYRKLVIDNNRIIGAILYGDIKDMLKIFKSIEQKKDIGNIKNELKKWNLNSL